MLALLLPALAPIIERLTALIPDPEARAKAVAEAQSQIVSALQASDLAQLAVDKQEAGHSSVFVAGWRPLVGWTCALAMANQYLVVPIVPWLSSIFGYDLPVPPQLVDAQLYTLLFGMLGLGTLRSYEKVQGAETVSLRPYINARSAPGGR